MPVAKQHPQRWHGAAKLNRRGLVYLEKVLYMVLDGAIPATSSGRPF
jgi:hypothetical protein